jgi:hypothetical protein
LDGASEGELTVLPVGSGRLAFTDYVAELFGDDSAKLDEWPEEHWGVVGRLVHES